MSADLLSIQMYVALQCKWNIEFDDYTMQLGNSGSGSVLLYKNMQLESGRTEEQCDLKGHGVKKHEVKQTI